MNETPTLGLQRSRWINLTENVWDDGRRYVAVAKVGRTRKRTKRFPRSTALRTITDWIADTCVELRKDKRTIQRLEGTFAGAVAAYVSRLPTGRAKSNTRSYLAAWVRALGEVSDRSLTAERLEDVVHAWIAAGIAANSIKHRRRALAQLFEKRGDTTRAALARALPVPREPEPLPRGVDMPLLDAVLSTIDPARGPRGKGASQLGRGGSRNKALARLRMMQWTGLGPASLKRLSPRDVNLEAATITLPARRKGRGAAAVTLPLFPQGVEACRAWLQAFAFGAFDNRALGRCFHAAVDRYRAQETAAGRTVDLPGDLKPYDLRHSFLDWVYLTTGKEWLVQLFGQHADLKTTKRYTLRAVHQQAALAVADVRAAMQMSPPESPSAPGDVYSGRVLRPSQFNAVTSQ